MGVDSGFGLKKKVKSIPKSSIPEIIIKKRGEEGFISVERLHFLLLQVQVHFLETWDSYSYTHPNSNILALPPWHWRSSTKTRAWEKRKWVELGIGEKRPSSPEFGWKVESPSPSFALAADPNPGIYYTLKRIHWVLYKYNSLNAFSSVPSMCNLSFTIQRILFLCYFGLVGESRFMVVKK